MTPLISTLLGATLGGLALAHLASLTAARRRRAREAAGEADAAVAGALAGARDVSTGTVGVRIWAGHWEGQRAQVRTVVDTLAARKLPAIWLSAAITEPVRIGGTLDVMRRPAGPTTFSRFDDLPETLPTPAGWPEDAVVRTDHAGATAALAALGEGLGLLAAPRFKELLITPNGVRLVVLAAEADRARYGVLRQAEFHGRDRLDPALIRRMLAEAEAVRRAVNARAPAPA